MVNTLVSTDRRVSLDGRVSDFFDEAVRLQRFALKRHEYGQRVDSVLSQIAERDGFDGDEYAAQTRFSAGISQLSEQREALKDKLKMYRRKRNILVINNESAPVWNELQRVDYQLAQLYSARQTMDLADEPLPEFKPELWYAAPEKTFVRRAIDGTVKTAKNIAVVMPAVLAGAVLAGVGYALAPSSAHAQPVANNSHGYMPVNIQSQFTVQGTILDYANEPVVGNFYIKNLTNDRTWHFATGLDGRFEKTVDTSKVGIKEQQKLNVFLNAYGNAIRYNVLTGPVNVRIVNALGQTVNSYTANAGMQSIAVADANGRKLAPGMYLVSVKSPELNGSIRVILGENGNILGRSVSIDDIVQPFGLAKPTLDDIFALNNTGIEGYEDSSRVFVPGVDFNGYEDIARVNMIPFLVSPLPDTISNGYDLRPHFGNDDEGIFLFDPPLFSVEAGKIAYKKPTQSQTVDLTVEYEDGVNPNLPHVVAKTVFRYVPKVAISGRIIDTDKYDYGIGYWTFNPSLQGWVCAVPGDTALADAEGRYSLVVPKGTLESLTAGYKYSDGKPASFVRTIRNIPASEDVNDLVIAVVSYENMGQGTPEEVTPELFPVMAYEANFRPGGSNQDIAYDGAKALDKDNARWVLIKVSERYGRSFTDEQWNELQRRIKEEINPTLRRPLPIVTYETPYYPASWEEAQGMILIEPSDISSIGYFDVNSDGVKDFVGITLDGLFGLDEETNSGLVAANFVEDPRLRDKTILYEWGKDIVTPADLKFRRFVECITHRVGGLHPKMQIGDVLRIQYQ